MNNHFSLPMKAQGAIISECGKYRYGLSRVWDSKKPLAFWLMHNPSKADEFADDPTIRRIKGFSEQWGYGGIIVGNLSPYRSTDPDVLKTLTQDELTPNENYYYIQQMMHICDVNFAAYGNPVDKRMLAMPLPVGIWWALRISKHGNPCHPLYLPKTLKPVRFNSIPLSTSIIPNPPYDQP